MRLSTAAVNGMLGVLSAVAAVALALALARSLGRDLLLAALFGSSAELGGKVAAFVVSLAVGATQALVAVAMALLAQLCSRRRRVSHGGPRGYACPGFDGRTWSSGSWPPWSPSPSPADWRTYAFFLLRSSRRWQLLKKVEEIAFPS